MDLSAVMTRLQAELVGLKAVGTVADMDVAVDAVVATPSAFVVPLAETAEAMDSTGNADERLTQVFGVVHVLANRRDSQGAASLADLATLRRNLRAALVGWVPDDATAEPVHFRAGRLLRMDGDGRLWWMDEFGLVKFEWSN